MMSQKGAIILIRTLLGANVLKWISCTATLNLAWLDLSRHPRVSFGVCLKKKKMRAVTILGGCCHLHKIKAPWKSTILCTGELWGGEGRTDLPVQGPSTAALPPAGAHGPQIGLEALAAKVPHHFSVWTLYGNNPRKHKWHFMIT